MYSAYKTYRGVSAHMVTYTLLIPYNCTSNCAPQVAVVEKLDYYSVSRELPRSVRTANDMTDTKAQSEVHRKRAYAVSIDSGIGRGMNSGRSISTITTSDSDGYSVSSAITSIVGSISSVENGEEQVSWTNSLAPLGC